MKKLILSLIIPLIFLMYGCDRVPEFKTTPETTAYEGSEYTYEVRAVDPDGKSVSYSLVDAPEGMKIIKNLITWTPTFQDQGDHLIKIKADDSRKSSYQEYTLSVHYQITGFLYFLNLSDEKLYASPGLTVNISGGTVNASAVSDATGFFRIEDVPAGEYRYDIQSPLGNVWSFDSSERKLTFSYPARITWGGAVISGTLTSDVGGIRTLSLPANQRTITFDSNTWNFRIDGLFATSIESVAAKQNTSIDQYKFGLHIHTDYPLTYTYIYPVTLENGVEFKLDNIILQDRDILTKYYWLDTDGQVYSIEMYGYVRMPDSMFQTDPSTFTRIENQAGANYPMGVYQEYLELTVGYGQNLIKGVEWYGPTGWAPFKAYNLATAEFLKYDLGYPLYPAVGSGTVFPEIATMSLMKGPELNGVMPGDSQIETQPAEPSNMIETTVKVVRGVGLTPVFSWWAPPVTEHNPQIYVATVGEVNASNQITKVVWTGITQRGVYNFPKLTIPVLQAGKRYIFYVTTYSADSVIFSQDNVLCYPDNLNYWFARSEGILFEP